jgi:hypothetical protein
MVGCVAGPAPDLVEFHETLDVSLGAPACLAVSQIGTHPVPQRALSRGAPIKRRVDGGRMAEQPVHQRLELVVVAARLLDVDLSLCRREIQSLARFRQEDEVRWEETGKTGGVWNG